MTGREVRQESPGWRAVRGAPLDPNSPLHKFMQHPNEGRAAMAKKNNLRPGSCPCLQTPENRLVCALHAPCRREHYNL